MSQKSVKFHIKSDDYFGTLATVLSLVSQAPKNGKHNIKILEKLVEDLTYLQKNYKITGIVKNKNKQVAINREYWNLFFWYYYGIKNTLDIALIDYKKISNIKNSEFKINTDTAKYVYMQYIIADVGKIIGLTEADQFGVKKLVTRLLAWKNGIKSNDVNDIFEVREAKNLKMRLVLR